MNEHPREEEKKMIRTNTKNLFFFLKKKCFGWDGRETGRIRHFVFNPNSRGERIIKKTWGFFSRVDH
jgi:hypothetical protein